MFLDKKGAEEGLSWVGYAILVVVAILVIYFIFHLGLFGDVKKAFSKTFGTGEEYVKLYEEHFEEELSSSEIDRKTNEIKEFILNTFSIKKDDCLGILDLNEVDIDRFSVYFSRNLEKKGTDFYIFEGGWRDDLSEAILGNKYIKHGFLDSYVISSYDDKIINEFLLSNNLEYINFLYEGKRGSLRLTNPGFMEIISITGRDKGQIYIREQKATNFRILSPVFYKLGKNIKILSVEASLDMDLNKSSCTDAIIIEYK